MFIFLLNKNCYCVIIVKLLKEVGKMSEQVMSREDRIREYMEKIHLLNSKNHQKVNVSGRENTDGLRMEITVDAIKASKILNEDSNTRKERQIEDKTRQNTKLRSRQRVREKVRGL